MPLDKWSPHAENAAVMARSASARPVIQTSTFAEPVQGRDPMSPGNLALVDAWSVPSRHVRPRPRRLQLISSASPTDVAQRHVRMTSLA